jgi:hypothetical protein
MLVFTTMAAAQAHVPQRAFATRAYTREFAVHGLHD